MCSSTTLRRPQVLSLGGVKSSSSHGDFCISNIRGLLCNIHNSIQKTSQQVHVVTVLRNYKTHQNSKIKILHTSEFQESFLKRIFKAARLRGAISSFISFYVEMLFPRATLLIWYPTKACGEDQECPCLHTAALSSSPSCKCDAARITSAYFPHTKFSQYIYGG